jgi:WD40 repeat protein
MFGMKPSRVAECPLADCWYFDVGQYVLDLVWSPGGRQVALVTVEGRVFVVDQADGAGVLRRVGAHERGATSVAWRADGEEFATAGQDGWIKIWDADSLQLRRQMPAGSEWGAKVAYQPGRERLATAAGKLLRIWSPDDRLLVVGQENGGIAGMVSDLAGRGKIRGKIK